MAFTSLVGSWPDVVATVNGVAVVRVTTLASGVGTVICEENQVEIWRRTVTTGLRPKFTRINADPVTGDVKVLVSVAIAGNNDRAVLVSESAETDLGINVFGNWPLFLAYESGDFVAYIVISSTQYRRYPLSGSPSSPINNPFVALGVGTVAGIRDVEAGTVLWEQATDGSSNFASVVIGTTSFYHYRTRGTVTVGQQKGPPETPEGIIASPDGVGISTVIPIRAFNPTLANVTVGPFAGKTVIVARSATVITAQGVANVAMFAGPPWPDYDSSTATGQLGLAGVYKHPVTKPEDRRITEPWYLFFDRLVKKVFGPIDLSSAQVHGSLSPENGGTGSNSGLDFIVEQFGLLQGLTGDVEASGPGVAEATIVRQYVPVVVGENIVFVGGDGVALVKTEVGV